MANNISTKSSKGITDFMLKVPDLKDPKLNGRVLYTEDDVPVRTYFYPNDTSIVFSKTWLEDQNYDLSHLEEFEQPGGLTRKLYIVSVFLRIADVSWPFRGFVGCFETDDFDLIIGDEVNRRVLTRYQEYKGPKDVTILFSTGTDKKWKLHHRIEEKKLYEEEEKFYIDNFEAVKVYPYQLTLENKRKDDLLRFAARKQLEEFH